MTQGSKAVEFANPVSMKETIYTTIQIMLYFLENIGSKIDVGVIENETIIDKMLLIW